MANIGGEDFTATGLMVTERNWLVIYEPFERWTGRNIPEFFQGQEFVPSVLVVGVVMVWWGIVGGRAACFVVRAAGEGTRCSHHHTHYHHYDDEYCGDHEGAAHPQSHCPTAHRCCRGAAVRGGPCQPASLDRNFDSASNSLCTYAL